jgi:CheY-like chemotaxis protein
MKPFNVLLIDDDEDDRSVFTSAMGTISERTNCIALEDAALALQQLEEKLLTPDVIFLDLNMPKMDGKEFYLTIQQRQDLSHIPIVIFSTASYLKSRESEVLNAAPFISKPDTFNDLKEILQTYLGSNFSQFNMAV